jgi:hypothetical protein
MDFHFERVSFEGDAMTELCSAAETRDVVITGTTPFTPETFTNSLSEVLTKLLLSTPDQDHFRMTAAYLPYGPSRALHKGSAFW